MSLILVIYNKNTENNELRYHKMANIGVKYKIVCPQRMN